MDRAAVSGCRLHPVMKVACALLFLLAAMSPGRAQNPFLGQEFQSAKIIQTVTPEFPPGLYAAYSHGGIVHLAMSVDASGHLVDCLVTGSTAPKFGELAVAAVRQWRFEPARWRGEPVPVCIALTFNYEVKGVVISIVGSDSAGRFMSEVFPQMGATRLYQLNELDRRPTPIRADPPHYPQWLADHEVAGNVVVEFYIDETGAVRLPIVVAWPQDNLANYAVEAVQHWKFEPATHHGRPVMVYAQQTFQFGRPAGP